MTHRPTEVLHDQSPRNVAATRKVAHGSHTGDRPQNVNLMGDSRQAVSAATATDLRVARAARGWSLRQAAVELGISYQHVHHFERARRAPSPSVAEALISGLGLGPTTSARLRSEAVVGRGRDWQPPADGLPRHRTVRVTSS